MFQIIELMTLGSSTGSILFGGVDTAKYSGSLISFGMVVDSNGNVGAFDVALTSVSATSPTGTDQLTPEGYSLSAVLDSGTTMSYLPGAIVSSIYEELNVIKDPNLGEILEKCFSFLVVSRILESLVLIEHRMFQRSEDTAMYCLNSRRQRI